MPEPPKTQDLLQELAKLSEALKVILKALPESVPTEPEVWSVYAGLEKIVALLKFRSKIETPGVFRELPKSATPVSLLVPALEAMKEGEAKLKSGELPEGLESLRIGRDNLRSYLSEERKTRARIKRRGAAAARPSS